jgi:hypothetical protein
VVKPSTIELGRIKRNELWSGCSAYSCPCCSHGNVSKKHFIASRLLGLMQKERCLLGTNLLFFVCLFVVFFIESVVKNVVIM